MGCRLDLGHTQTANDKKTLRSSRLPEAVYPAPAEFFMAMFMSLASERIKFNLPLKSCDPCSVSQLALSLSHCFPNETN